MTISTTTSRISYNGNGVTTVFSFPYRFLANGDLTVVSVSSTGVETTKTLTTDYTLTGAGDDAGGTVTMLAAPASGTRLIIYRDTDIVQETDYISGDPFPAETHERALDRLTMIAQEIGSDADRSIKVPVGDSSSLSTVLPAAANRLDKFIVFDATTGETELSTVTQTQVASAVAAAYAAGSTADAVTFLQAGTGAVSRSVQSKMREVVSVTDFGAVGDGTTDDTAAIQLALDLGKEVHGVTGQTYRITSGLTATVAGAILDLNGASLLADFTTGWAFSAGDGVLVTQRVGIRNGVVYTADASTALNGVRWRKNVRRRIAYENLYIKSFKGTGAKFEEANWSIQGAFAPLIEACGVNLHIDDNANAISLAGCHLYDADTYNLIIRGAWATSIIGGVNQGAVTAGILIDNGLVGSLQISNQVTITGVYLEDNGVNHIVANNGRGLNVSGNFINGDVMSGPAIKLTAWVGADIDGNSVSNMSAGTARDFVEADSGSSMVSVGKQHVTGIADAVVCGYGGSRLGIVESFGDATATLPTATVTNRGGVVLYAPGSGTGANRSRPYMGMDTASGARSYLRIATQPRKMAAAAVTSPYTPTLASIETFDITVPNTGLTIEAPTGSYDDGERITFLLKQNSTGGGNITWNAAFKTAYSNTGNTADKYASVEFVWSAGRSLWIEVSAMAWT